MSLDLAFNQNLAQAQLTALQALQAIITDSAQPLAGDAARVKATVQLITIRLRGATALLRMKPRKIQPETASQPAPAPRERATDLTIAAIEAALTFGENFPPLAPHSPTPASAQVTALMQRAGTPQHVPRSDRAA